MKGVWKVILIIVVVMLILGAVSIGVGITTGADISRIHQVLDNRYHIDMYLQYAQQVVISVESQLQP